jgi:hypothetical protein
MSVCTKAIWVFDVSANEMLFHTPCRHTFTSNYESDVTVWLPTYANVFALEH